MVLNFCDPPNFHDACVHSTYAFEEYSSIKFFTRPTTTLKRVLAENTNSYCCNNAVTLLKFNALKFDL